MRLSRRTLLGHAIAAGGLTLSGRSALADERGATLKRGLAGLERRHGGRLGVAVLDTAGGGIVAHRGGERFAMCSTFKFVAAACVLARVDRGQERLDRRIVYARGDLVTYSPFTEKHVDGDGASVADLCDAAITLSDNTAANLLLGSFGGPAGMTAYFRSLGDNVSRLDRWEPAMAQATPGDPRDTTSPVAMLGLLQKTLLGDALSPASRERLLAWLVANKTGDTRLRAGVPTGWQVGDKTGAGGHNTTNDVAITRPPGRAPILVSAYYTGAAGTSEQRNAVLADVARLATAGRGYWPK